MYCLDNVSLIPPCDRVLIEMLYLDLHKWTVDSLRSHVLRANDILTRVKPKRTSGSPKNEDMVSSTTTSSPHSCNTGCHEGVYIVELIVAGSFTGGQVYHLFTEHAILQPGPPLHQPAATLRGAGSLTDRHETHRARRLAHESCTSA